MSVEKLVAKVLLFIHKEVVHLMLILSVKENVSYIVSVDITSQDNRSYEVFEKDNISPRVNVFIYLRELMVVISIHRMLKNISTIIYLNWRNLKDKEVFTILIFLRLLI